MARFYKGCNKVAGSLAIRGWKKSVAAIFFSMHKRLAATDFDRQIVAKVF